MASEWARGRVNALFQDYAWYKNDILVDRLADLVDASRAEGASCDPVPPSVPAPVPCPTCGTACLKTDGIWIACNGGHGDRQMNDTYTPIVPPHPEQRRNFSEGYVAGRTYGAKEDFEAGRREGDKDAVKRLVGASKSLRRYGLADEPLWTYLDRELEQAGRS